MTAPQGKCFWEASCCDGHGPGPVFGSPETLWAAAGDSLARIENNPLYEDAPSFDERPLAFQGAVARTVRRIAYHPGARALGRPCANVALGDYHQLFSDGIRTTVRQALDRHCARPRTLRE